jgi:hypothetical protein
MPAILQSRLDISPPAAVIDRGRLIYDWSRETLKKDPQKLDQPIDVSSVRSW